MYSNLILILLYFCNARSTQADFSSGTADFSSGLNLLGHNFPMDNTHICLQYEHIKDMLT